MQRYLIVLLVLGWRIAAPAEVLNSYDLRPNGTIPAWLVAGPFPNGKPLYHGSGCFGYFKDYLTGLGGETHCQPKEGEAIEFGGPVPAIWRMALSDGAGVLDFIELFQADKSLPAVAYAYCALVSHREQPLLLRVRSNDGVRMWLNQDLVLDHHVGRGLDSAEDTVQVTLLKGLNRVLLKIDQGGGAWGCALALSGIKNPQAIAAQVHTRQPLQGHLLAATFSSTSLLAKTPDGERQVVVADITSGGAQKVSCVLRKQEWSAPLRITLGDLAAGKHRKEILVPPVTEAGPVHISLAAGSVRRELDAEFHPPRKWTVYLNQHTHTDIGYTKPQHEIMAEHLRYIDYALDYCDLTDTMPEPAQFRWTCEVSWAVDEWLRRRPPQQQARLKKRVLEGRIEIGGLYLHLSDIADENVMAASLQPIRTFKQFGLPVVTGIQNDVPGMAWCLVDFFADTDVKYLTLAINNDRTPRAFEVPTLFWWESAAGKRLLTWRPDHYHTGNHLGLDRGQIEPFKIRLLEYLEMVKRNGYPFDRIAVQYSGRQIDNSPPDMAVCGFISRWNQTYAWPQLRSATMREFLDYGAEQHGATLPVWRGAWPSWWTDGFGFASRETAVARKAHADVQSIESLFALAGLQGQTLQPATLEQLCRVKKDLLFYDEHTFGAQEEFTDPLAVNSVEQYNEKAAYIWGAVAEIDLLRSEATGLFGTTAAAAAAAEPTISVLNPLAWTRSGVVRIFLDYSVVPPDKKFRLIDAATGQPVPIHRLESRVEGSYWLLWVKDVPALAGKTLHFDFNPMPQQTPVSRPAVTDVLENEHYRLQLDPGSGAIQSLVDKETRTELVDQSAAWQMGQFIYDLLSDSQFDGRASYLQRSRKSTLRDVRMDLEPENPFWQSVRISATADGCLPSVSNPGVQLSIRLYSHTKMVELYFEIVKKFVPLPEAVYVAFPFSLSDGKFLYDTLGGLVTPGETQLPGSSSDWHAFQHMVALRDSSHQIVVTSDAMPLVQFGDINIGKWQKVARIEKPHVYSWVINNYWTAPYPGAKEGVQRWSYFLTSGADTAKGTAMRFGMNCRTPLAARVSPVQDPIRMSAGGWPATLPANILVANLRPAMDGKGAIVQMRELEGKHSEAAGGAGVHIVNVLEERLASDAKQIEFEPFEVKFVKLDF